MKLAEIAGSFNFNAMQNWPLLCIVYAVRFPLFRYEHIHKQAA